MHKQIIRYRPAASRRNAKDDDMLFDAHTHLNEERYTDEERAELAYEIEQSPVDYIMDAGSCFSDTEQAIKDAEKYPWCYASAGIHPEEVGDLTEEKMQYLRELALHDKVRAIGEIGLDYYYDDGIPRGDQQKWFRRQIQLANELKMPIMIHSRDADLDTLTILKEEGAFSDERKSWFPKRPVTDRSGCAASDAVNYAQGSAAGAACGKESGSQIGDVAGTVENSGEDGAGVIMLPDARVLMHCFSYSAETASEYVKLGATISICGPVTFKSNKKTRRVVEAVPIDYLTVETDAPYLAPEPMRGRQNKPPYVQYTCRKIAEIKGITYEEAAAATRANAMRFYGIEERD